MTMLTFGTWNLLEGGLGPGGDGTRLRRQLSLLNNLGADAWALQECQGWQRDGYRLLHVAERVLGMRGFLAQSNHDGCDLCLFVRESPRLRVTGQRHDRRPPFWHALACVETDADGHDGPLYLVSAHLAPASPSIRLAEAESLALLPKHGTVIAGGDWNAAPVTGYHPEPVSPPERRKLDRRAAQAIEDAGFHDCGSVAGDTTPTVGYLAPGQLAYRCDRIYTTLPKQAITGCQVITEAEPDSDHRPVMATIDLSATATADGVPR